MTLTLQKFESLEKELEGVELRILEAVWSLERSLLDQIDNVRCLKSDLSEIKELLIRTKSKQVAPVDKLTTKKQ
jgi:hypothetical protein